MPEFTSQIAYYLERYKNGHWDDAFHSLLEMDHRALPELMMEFRRTDDIDLRIFLVNVIWEHRQQSCVEFLREALFDLESRVWREALNGLVTLASPAALEVLRAGRAREFPAQRKTDEFRQWLEEAIEQTEDEIRRKGT